MPEGGALLLVLADTAGRFLALNTVLCWTVVSLSGLLAPATRSVSRGGTVSAVWFGTLFVLWTALLIVMPSGMTAGFTWCEVPLVCLASRALDRTWALAVLAAVSLSLLAVGTRQATGFQPDVVQAPIAIARIAWRTLRGSRGSGTVDRALNKHSWPVPPNRGTCGTRDALSDWPGRRSVSKDGDTGTESP